ncbi:MAG: hypothetical protein ACOC38_09340, partial [Promethearchaeia archaeon]
PMLGRTTFDGHKVNTFDFYRSLFAPAWSGSAPFTTQISLSQGDFLFRVSLKSSILGELSYDICATSLS